MFLQLKIEELRSRLDEKNRMIEKKTHQSMMGTHDRAKCCAETEELRNHVDIRERKISVLQRKVNKHVCLLIIFSCSLMLAD